MPRPPQDDNTDTSESRRLQEVARIKGLLVRKKLTLRNIDERYNLPAGTASNTLKVPHIAAERAIAAALGTRPELLWRSRYHSDGRRMVPQPKSNYQWVRLGTQAAA